MAVEHAKNSKETQVDLNEHLLSIDEIQAKYAVTVDLKKPSQSPGLSALDAAKRLKENGPNCLTPPKKLHPFLQYLLYLLHLFNVMLWVSGIVALIIFAVDSTNNFPNVYIGSILLFVAFMNAFVDFYQTQKSQAILESFLNLIPSKCYVIRDGQTTQISAVELVVGDIVYIRSGDKIPADLVIFASTEIKVDNSSLTGEVEAQGRGVTNTQNNPLEATNLIFNGTLAVNGEAYGIVIRTGDNTVIGQIAFMTSSEERRPSPMSAEIENYVTLIASIASVIALAFFLISLFVRNRGLAFSFNFAIGTFTSFVPQGLPTTVSVLLSLAAKRMASRNVLVKDLQSVETLGAITLLATDKTGTLTRNQMTVTYVWSGDKLYYCPAVAEQGVDAIPFDLNRAAPNEVIHMSALCSRARFENNEGPIATRPVLGDATEAGLLRNAAQKLLDFEKLHDTYPKVFEIPFNSENKWAMTIHKKKHSDGPLTLYLKGAPERVLRLCSTFHDGQNIVPLTEEHKKKFDQTYSFMASKGHRVLAFSALQLPGDKYPAFHEFKKDLGNYPQKDLTFYGLVSLEDPPKHGVREAIGHCREAGIRVMMVTGDHPLTAESIGRKINLMLQDTKQSLAAKRGCDISQIREDEVNAVVIHGEQIDDLAEEDWDRIFSKEEIIFARTSPKHKLTIVKHAQSLGHIVGVTGDGVNDSPALKKADLGIAMNISGSDVSKEAAAMILVDDNFASCINGIEEGRLIFQNLKKSIKYTITHTMPEAWANLMNIAIPMPLAMSPMLILVSDLGFEMFLALSFAWDVPENRAGLMKLQPRKPVTDKLVARLKDAEKNGPPSFSKRMHQKFFDPVEEEVLIDQGVLSWAFLEVGTIETIACFTCYFFSMYYTYGVTPSDQIKNADDYGLKEFTLSNGNLFDVDTQVKALFVGNAAYYFCLMITQCFNLMCCKARLGLPYGSFMFANPKNFYGMLFAIVFCSCIVYIPPINVVFTSNYLMTGYVWLIAIGFGIFIYIYAIIRTLILRARNPVKYSDEIVGLDLHPTRFSTGR